MFSKCLSGGGGGTLNSLNVRVSETYGYMAQQNLVGVQTIHYLCLTLQPRVVLCITVKSNDSTKDVTQVFTGRAVYSGIELISSFLQRT